MFNIKNENLEKLLYYLLFIDNSRKLSHITGYYYDYDFKKLNKFTNSHYKIRRRNLSFSDSYHRTIDNIYKELMF